MELIEELLHPPKKEQISKKTQRKKEEIMENMILLKFNTFSFRNILRNMSNRKFYFLNYIQ